MGVIISAISGGEVVAAGLDADDVMEIEVDGVSRFVKLSSLVAALQTIDPITGADLDPLTVHEPFVVQDAGDKDVFRIIDDGGNHSIIINDPATEIKRFSFLPAFGNFTIWDTAGASPRLDFTDTGATYTDNSAQVRMIFDVGAGLLQFDSEGTITMRDAQPVARVDLKTDGSGLTLTNAAGTPIQRITDTTTGFFAATPYGQDAYIDPTTITPEQLGLAQIARGWMAAV